MPAVHRIAQGGRRALAVPLSSLGWEIAVSKADHFARWLLRSFRGLLAVAVVAALNGSCDRISGGEGACAGLKGRREVTSTDFTPCAREMLAALDDAQKELERFVVRGDGDAKPAAEAALKRMQRLMRSAGYEADQQRIYWASIVGKGEKYSIEQRWPNPAIRAFNGHVGGAYAHFDSALRYPNRGNLDYGSKEHDFARRAYYRF